jgi:carbon-monoxide dehydrogenase large subunit
MNVPDGTSRGDVRDIHTGFNAVDDCGVRISPMIVEGQIHRGLADGQGIAQETGTFLVGSKNGIDAV